MPLPEQENTLATCASSLESLEGRLLCSGEVQWPPDLKWVDPLRPDQVAIMAEWIGRKGQGIDPADGGSSENLNTFTFYGALAFSNKPNLSTEMGLKPINIQYWTAINASNYDALMTDDALRQAARSFEPGSIVVLDVEGIATSSWDDAIVNYGIEKLSHIADIIHAENPTVKLGFFGSLCSVELWYGAYLSGPGSTADLRWKAVNLRLDELAQHVDIIFPELYAMYQNSSDWVAASTMMLQESHRYGKPVIPFISPAFPGYVEDHPELAWKDLPADYYRSVLDLVSKNSDSAVIWGGWNGAVKPWDGAASWVQTTREFTGVTVL